MTARKSSVRPSSVGTPTVRWDSPCGACQKVNCENDASRRKKRAKWGSSQKHSMLETQPMTKTVLIGPRPTT